MPIMIWSEKLDVGIGAMNDEHRVLLDWMNKLYDRHEAGVSKAEIVMLAQQLENATITHFRSEEAYMASIGFPGLRHHKMSHAALLGTLADYIKEIRGGDGRIPSAFFTFLKVWLTAHVMDIDTKYRAHATDTPLPVEQAIAEAVRLRFSN